MNLNKFLIFIILILFFVCFAAAPKTADAKAFLYLVPSEETFGVGEEFLVFIKVDSRELPMNAVSGILYFSKDKLSVVSISKENSIFSLWPEEPSFSNDSGEIIFGGGLPSPGFIGADGQIISIRFKAKDRGVASLDFGESMILADDGKGTNICSYTEGANLSLKNLAPEVFSSTHSDSEKWYSDNNPEFRWELSSNVVDVSFILDKNPNSEPDEISEGRLDSKIYEKIDDGTRYFHLRVKDNLSWSLTRHFVVNIDITPPNPFEIAVNNQGDSTNPQPILVFEAIDDVSGIDYYTVELETGNIFILANPGISEYRMPLQEPGMHHVVVKAYDRAGNFRENTAGLVVESIKEPIITIWPKIYISGEEKFYIEGEALPKAEVMLFLEKDNTILKQWKAPVDERGRWSFSTTDIFSSGVYYLFTKAKDTRGALSNPSPQQEVEIIFNGLALGSFMITYRNLVSGLVILLLVLIVLAIYFTLKSLKTKKILRKETKEVEESLHTSFSELKQDIVKELEKLEGVKSQRELDEKEQEIIGNLKEDLKKIEKFIGKEIKDVENELE